MQTEAQRAESTRLQPPRPRSVTAFVFMIVWIAAFQVTGRTILMTRHFLYGSKEGLRRAVDHNVLTLALVIFTDVVGVAFCLLLAFFALKQLKRRTRLISERVFYVCLLILAGSIIFDFFRHRVTFQASLAVEWIRAVLAWIATGASIVLIRRRRQWEQFVQARARHRRTINEVRGARTGDD